MRAMRMVFYMAIAGLLWHPVVCQSSGTSRESEKLKNESRRHQARFANSFRAVEDWLARGAFPSAVLAVGQHGRIVALKAFGRSEYCSCAKKIRPNTIFDLASVSKAVGATTAAALLYDTNKLDLDAPVVRYLPEFAGLEGHEEVSVRQLLTHSSGIPTPGRMHEKASDKIGVLKQIFAVPLASKPGSQFVYRDTNFILLGEVVERASGMPLDDLLRRQVFEPLGMQDTFYNPPPKLHSRVAPTEYDARLRKRIVRGQVHDENCYVMGGVSGHAGLFSTAPDLSIFAQMFLNKGVYHGKRILSSATVELFATRQDLPLGSTRALGWDTGSPDSLAGEQASPRAVLHEGFTGTSIYIDPDRDAFIVFLSNRVHPSRQNQAIDQARRDVHAAVLKALDAGAGN